MDTEGLLSVYLALAAMLATLITLVVAGLIAVFQVIGKQIPKRSLNEVIGLSVQLIFIFYITFLLIISLLAAWALSIKHDILPINIYSTEVLQDSWFLLWVIAGLFVAYAIFIFILFQSRLLFDDKKYIAIISKQFTAQQLADFMYAQYATEPFYFKFGPISFADSSDDDEENERKEAEKLAKHEQQKRDHDVRMKKVVDTKDPLGELFQYAFRSNAFDDVEEYVIPLITEKLVEFVLNQKKVPFLDDYMQKEVTSMLDSFSGEPRLSLKKAFIDMTKQVAIAVVEKEQYSLALNIASRLHQITKDETNDHLKLYGLKALEEVSERYDELAKDTLDEREYLNNYQNFRLLAARMAENYYHNMQNLSPVAIIEDNHHENEGFSGVLVNYLIPDYRFRDGFGDKAMAVHFDAIDLSAEALAGAMARSSTVSERIGSSSYSYGTSLTALYYVFYDTAKHAIENGNYDVAAGAIFRLKRGIKFMYEHDLKDASIDIGDSLYSLGVMMTSLSDETHFGKTSYKTASEVYGEIAETINTNVLDMDAFRERRSGMDHTLFDYINEPEANNFVSLIEWDRDDPPAMPTSRVW